MNCFTSQHCCACPKPGHGFPMPYATVFLCSMVWGKRCGSFWYWWNSWSSITVKTFFSYQVFKLYCFIGLYYQNRWLILKWKIFGRLSYDQATYLLKKIENLHHVTSTNKNRIHHSCLADFLVNEPLD